MRTLTRVLANGVVDALRTREHVVVAPAGSDALRDEVEAIIAPALSEMAPHINGDVVRRDAAKLQNADADEVMAALVMQITEQLMESDHIDDIYAEDRIIRRDAYRAIRDILIGYIRGEVDVDSEPESEGVFEVRLHELGYVVSTVSRRLPTTVLLEVLVHAAESVGGALVEMDMQRRIAGFDLAGGAAVGRLALEEAITEELVALVEDGSVELPSLEQMLEVDRGVAALEGFEEALARAAVKTNSVTGCAAGCVVVDEDTLLASLTPLTEQAAQHAEHHFAFFLSCIEGELENLGEPAAPSSRAEVPRASRTRSRSKAARTKKRGA